MSELDLDLLQIKLDEALEKETPESLSKWLLDNRKNNPINTMDFDDDTVNRFCHDVCQIYAVPLYIVTKGDEHCKANGEESYINRSFSAGHIKHGNSDIWLGIYDNPELKLISFMHELGHVVGNYTSDMSTYDCEQRAWEVGYMTAEMYGIKFSDEATSWALDQLNTYAGATTDGEKC